MRTSLATGLAVLLLSVSVGAQDDDVDPLAELAALGDAVAEEGPEAGGSIRAKRDIKRDPRNLEAKVETVKHGKFPAVAVRIKITKPAKEGPGKGVKRNQQIVLTPKMKVKDGRVDMADAETLKNAGAFFLKSGDKVFVRLGASKGKVWEAESIERK